MPLFEYKCNKCGSIFEILNNKSEKISCLKCNSTNVKRLFSAPSIIKGTVGNGKTCCGMDERCNTPPCSDRGTCVR